ncbi:MAG: VOC family protein [Paracoccus sp. (in: a-proteobacteria)]|nr:VOC family protein [Paracoccus sp. (in: a-proteobacteria)]
MNGEREIAEITLDVRDLDRVAAFYRDVIGLALISESDGSVQLGAGDDAFLTLRARPGAAPRRADQPGLYHTAFLLPNRAALGGWLHHAARDQIELDGASDHGVSEALYLTDPEGNGIEIYADRPASEWQRRGARVEMTTKPLDLRDVMAAGDRWQGAPAATRIGHVHLAVADVGAARAFFTETLGLTETFDAPSAAWFGWDGYHHHFAANSWHSAGARRPEAPHTGLAEITLRGIHLPKGLTGPDGVIYRGTA